MTQITASATALARILRDVKSVVKPRQTMQILGHVMFDARDGQVTITATDLDMQIVRTFAAEVGEAGAFTVEAERFTNVIGSFPDGAQVELTEADGFVSLKSGRSRFRFPTLTAKDFPPLPFAEPITSFDGDARLLQALAAVRHAVSTNETRFHLCGAFIGTKDGGLEIAATDGDQCLAVCRPDLQADIEGLTIGTAAIDALTKRGGEYKVEICADAEGAANKIRFTWADASITAKLIEGAFPAYAKVIPTETFDAIADGDDVAGALNRIAMLSDDKERSIRFMFEPDKLTITNNSRIAEDVMARAGHGGVEEMPCAYSGEPISITFKSSIIGDAIKSLDADKVCFGLRSAVEPCKVTSPSRPEMTLVAMPMRG